MSSYFFLGLAAVCLFAGIVWDFSPLHVMGSVFIVGSVIIARLDAVIALLRAKK
jgi:hypothetical protein